jgi:putative proteasome-type protease
VPGNGVQLKRDQYEIARHISIDDDNAYFASIRKRWSEGLREVFVQLPEPDWLRSRQHS